jgi:hypothetical protein
LGGERREEYSEDERSVDSAPEPSDDDRRRRRKGRRPDEPDSRGLDQRVHCASRLGSDDIQEDEAKPEPLVDEMVHALRREVEELGGQVESLKALRPQPRCGTKKRSIPYRRSQGWASLRKKVIRIFGLKRASWELQGRRIDTSGQDGWRIMAQPLRQPGEGMWYRMVIRRNRRKSPGPRRGTTDGKLEDWAVV